MVSRSMRTDLADYNVYDIDVNTSAFNSAATGVKGAYTQDGSSYYYNTMTLQGRTLKFDASNNDEGCRAAAGRWCCCTCS